MATLQYKFARLKQILNEFKELTVPSEIIVDSNSVDYLVELRTEADDLLEEIEKDYVKTTFKLLDTGKQE